MSKHSQKKIKINENITSETVRVILDGNPLGIMSTSSAIEEAYNRGLDLVEVSPNAVPPVCKIIDYGKVKYEEAKKRKEASKKQHKVSLKEIKFRPNTGPHDFEFKVRNLKKFLLKGDRVKATVVFRGRENTHRELGMDVLRKVHDELIGVAKEDGVYKNEGKSIVSFYRPDPAKIAEFTKEMSS